MSAPTVLTVSYISAYTNGIATANATVTIPVRSSLQGLDSGQTAAGQTGFEAFDTLLAAITKRKGVRFSDSSGVPTFIPLSQITKITAS
jgi:hypothetical protein